MGLAGKNALVKVMSDAAAVVFTDETTSTTDNIVYTIDDRDLKYWDRDTAVVVEVDSVVADPSTYRVYHAGGAIVFNSSTVGVVTVSGAYVAVTTAAEVSEYSYSINGEIVDVSCFKEDTDPDRGFRIRLVNLIDANGTISGFENVNDLLKDYLLDSKAVVLEFDVDTTKTDYVTDFGEIFACYAVLENRELSAAIEGAVGSAVSWQSDGPLLIEQK